MAELLQPRARDRGHLTLAGGAGFGDRDPSMRRDGREHERHQSEIFTSPPCGEVGGEAAGWGRG